MSAGDAVTVTPSGEASLWFLLAGAALLGLVLSPLAELLIARTLPGLGGLPPLSSRVTTAAFTGATCAAFAFRFGPAPDLPAFLFLAVLGTQLAHIDLMQHLLPNPLVLSLLTGGAFLLILPWIATGNAGGPLRGLFGAIILFAGYLVLALISPAGLGMGDVKLAGPLGLYMGYLGWNHLLYGGLLGFILNALATLILVSFRRRGKGAEVAHGPSMLAAAAAVALILR
ncbi:prepilin peptidase [Pseudarthrobacter sp. NPDC092424]|uniref:prepilin peptidase n=1 Tax=Pseudarthrobacter sp. NPDC092424 TaxID=3364415 RepID=UPI003809C43F